MVFCITKFVNYDNFLVLPNTTSSDLKKAQVFIEEQSIISDFAMKRTPAHIACYFNVAKYFFKVKLSPFKNSVKKISEEGKNIFFK